MRLIIWNSAAEKSDLLPNNLNKSAWFKRDSICITIRDEEKNENLMKILMYLRLCSSPLCHLSSSSSSTLCLMLGMWERWAAGRGGYHQQNFFHTFFNSVKRKLLAELPRYLRSDLIVLGVGLLLVLVLSTL